ncbi:MAG TPA: hypothetical protein VGD78_05765 [Chthoniobacterales bacterium]
MALIDYLDGFPCLWATLLAFDGEQTAKLLKALDGCRGSQKVDEIECCLRHALEPGRSLVFDWLAEVGFAYREDGQWLIRRSPRVG